MPNTPNAIARDAFVQHFESKPELVATAPGRVNLIGEHTDYNDGFVLPAALHYHTCIAAGPRSDRKLQVIAVDEASARVSIALDEPAQHDAAAPWSNYLRGVVAALKSRGFGLVGANLTISGNVPLGAGLSSSAALEMASISALTQLSGEVITGVDAAKAGQAAENDFVGVRCGIMDQLISAQAKSDHALLIDCRSLALKPVQLPAELALLVINSNSPRTLVGGEYNTRRAQCEAATAHFSVDALRDLNLSALNEEKSALDPVVYRRARHVVTENERTLAMANALEQGDIEHMGRLMAQSHASMRDDFEITTSALDQLVNIVQEAAGERGGARMTGGGFGGCVVALANPNRVEHIVAQVADAYPKQTGLNATVMQCTTNDGAFAWQA